MSGAAQTSAPRVCVLTPDGRGAISVVAMAGQGSMDVVDRLFFPASGKLLASIPPNRIVFGRWGHEQGEEVVVSLRDDIIEVHCHGGNAASRAICDSLVAEGCEHVDQDTWMDGSAADPLSATARRLLGQAATQRAALVLLDQLNGALRSAVTRIDSLIETDQFEQATSELQTLIGRWRIGKHLVQPVRVVLTGPANVGKSSLINAMVGYERAIVFDTPGTTRDAVTAVTAIDGWAVELMDTAGLRRATSEVEQAGIDVARTAISAADLVLLVGEADTWLAGERLASEFDAWLAGTQVIEVASKIDRLTDKQLANLKRRAGGSFVLTSALKGVGVDSLLQAIRTAMVPDELDVGAAVPFAEGHVRALRKTLDALASNEPAAARNELLAFSA